MRLLESIKRFLRNLLEPPKFKPGEVEDSPELEIERERKHGRDGG